MPTRRAFLAAALLPAAAPKPALTLRQADSVHPAAALDLPEGGVFTLPRRRARLLSVLRLRAMEVTVAAFACDGDGFTQDLAAFIAPDGGLLAVERLTWRDGQGRELDTRIAMLPDREHIILQRSAARHETVWRRESWTDYLSMSGPTLQDAPPRPVLAGTWQDGLSRQRADIAGRIDRAAHRIDPALLALFAGPALA